MGQYYLIANKTKKQYLYPHVFNDGLKAWEIVANGETLKALGYLLIKSDCGDGGGDLKENPLVGYWAGDEIIIIGDYDSSKLYDEVSDTYTDISLTVISAMEKEDVFDKSETNHFLSYRKDYVKEHPIIPFDKLSKTGHHNPIKVTQS